MTDPRGAMTDPRGAMTDPRGAVTDPRGAMTDPHGGAATVFALLTSPFGKMPLRTVFSTLQEESGTCPAAFWPRWHET